MIRKRKKLLRASRIGVGRAVYSMLPESGEPRRWTSLKEEAESKRMSTATLRKYLKKLKGAGRVLRSVDVSTYPPTVSYRRVLVEDPFLALPWIKKFAQEEAKGISEELEEILKEKDTPKREEGIKYLVRHLIPKFSDLILLRMLKAADKKDPKARKDYLRTAMEVEIIPRVELYSSSFCHPEVLPIAKRVLVQHYWQWLWDSKRLYFFLKDREKVAECYKAIRSFTEKKIERR